MLIIFPITPSFKSSHNHNIQNTL